MIESFIAAMPKVELHLHLEGSLRPETMFDLAARNGVDLGVENAEELTAGYRFRHFDDFLRLFLQGLAVLRAGEDFALATEALASELADQNVRYAEVTTTPFNHHRRGVDMDDYVSGLNEGRRRARRLGVDISWVCDIPRELEPPDLGFTADFVLGPSAPEGVVALGLGGPEPGFPPRMFRSSFDRARAAGLGSVPHAGETEGPHFVREAVEILGADRIGHGTRSIEDDGLVSLLVERQIPLEVCLTSNQALGVVEIGTHPVRELMDRGVLVVLNTDDPAYFSTSLSRELEIGSEYHGFDKEAHLAMQRTAIETSFSSSKESLRLGLEDFATSKA